MTRAAFTKSCFFCISLLAIGCGAFFGQSVPFAEQWPMFEALRTTASIIFAVIGAWMAIAYPERLKSSFTQKLVPSDDSKSFSQLFLPVVNSTAILCVILIAGASAPILKRHVPADFVEYARGGSYGLLVTLTMWQLWTVVLTLIPANAVKAAADSDVEKANVTEDLFKLTSHK